jgi:hypothetical protein
MWIMVLTATVFALLPFAFSLGLKDINLSDEQSVITDSHSRHRSRSISSPTARLDRSRSRGRDGTLSSGHH